MENLYIKETKYTPEIKMDADKGLIEVKGKSYPENTFEFYEPIFKWLEEYFKNPQKITTINIELVYFNSSSSKLLFDFFDLLDEKREEGHKIIVNWIYDKENENAKEDGEDFKEDFEELEINLVSK